MDTFTSGSGRHPAGIAGIVMIMTEILLLHHAQGRTEGVLAFAESLRAEGHTVHTPDLYEGQVFATLEEGLRYAAATGFDTIRERGVRSADDLSENLVYAGFSLGGLPAQELAQTRPGALGALLLHSAIPPGEFGTWPGIPAQIHAMEGDPFYLEDREAALELQTLGAELFTYPGDHHLFTDSSLTDHDKAAAELATARVLEFLSHIG